MANNGWQNDYAMVPVEEAAAVNGPLQAPANYCIAFGFPQWRQEISTQSVLQIGNRRLEERPILRTMTLHQSRDIELMLFVFFWSGQEMFEYIKPYVGADYMICTQWSISGIIIFETSMACHIYNNSSQYVAGKRGRAMRIKLESQAGEAEIYIT